MLIGTYVSIITLNVNELNAPTKRYRLIEYIQEQDPYICCYRRPSSDLETDRLKVKGWKKIFHVNENQKKAGVAILISDKIEFKIKNIIRDQEGHYTMIKGSIQEEDTTVVNIYAPNLQAPQNIKQTLRGIRGEIDSNTVIVGDF